MVLNGKYWITALLALLLAACDGEPPTANNTDDDGSTDDGTDDGSDDGSDNGGGDTPANIAVGSGSGDSFMEGMLGISLTGNLSAGGSTEISLSIVDENNNNALYTSSTVDVSFSSTCSNQTPERAYFTPDETTGQGTITTTYTATGCRGTDLITAEVSYNDSVYSATGSVTVEGIEVGSITGGAPVPSTIAVRGFGTEIRPSITRVPFTVLDRHGSPVSNQLVTFNIENAIGGVQLTKGSGTTDGEGKVYAIAESGTMNTAFKVAATTEIIDSVGNPTGEYISTVNPYDITVNTGLPMDHWVTFGAETLNPDSAWGEFGVDVPISLIVSDRTGGPAAEGSVFSFMTNAGQVTGENGGAVESCVVSAGECSLNWQSANPWPNDNGVRILAFTRGDEYFIDENGNGGYDEGEYFCPLPEPYLDSNNSGSYDLGENFVDMNSDGTWDDVAAPFATCRNNYYTDSAQAAAGGDYSDGTGGRKYRGSSCSETARANDHCEDLTFLSYNSLMILSRPFLSITAGPTSVTIPGGNPSVTETYTVADDLGNIPANGTSIEVSCEELEAAVVNPADGSVPNVYYPPGTGFDFDVRFKRTDGTSPGLCEIKVGSALVEVQVTF